jgi:hypothetical protein
MEFARNYPGLICRSCDDKALNKWDRPARHNSFADDGDNPIFIENVKCWRRYKFGGFVTMRDTYDCENIEDFYQIIRPG